MSMKRRVSVAVGKLARGAARLRGGGGSALPGLVVEKLDPDFVGDLLGGLEHGVVVVSGTNGKTTTTKMVVELLESQGLRVFTNRTGSNFVRGVISELLGVVGRDGRLAADVAVLELDEAHAVKFVALCRPRYALLLNVMADQTDRFSEDVVAGKLAEVAAATTHVVVVNREDKRLRGVKTKAEVVYYGMDKQLRGMFGYSGSEVSGSSESGALPRARLVLARLDDRQRAEYRVGNKAYSTKLALDGIYNAYNAAGALTLASAVLPDISIGEFLSPLSRVTAADGRGESIMVGGQEVKLILVKNPMGFQLALKSFNSRRYRVAIAVNNAPADGVDLGWLKKVDFRGLDQVEIVGGVGADVLAGRLAECGVPVGRVERNFIKFWREIQGWEEPSYVFANYTAMMEIRKKLVGRS